MILYFKNVYFIIRIHIFTVKFQASVCQWIKLCFFKINMKSSIPIISLKFECCVVKNTIFFNVICTFTLLTWWSYTRFIWIPVIYKKTFNLIQLIKESSSGNEMQLDLEAVNFLSVSLSLWHCVNFHWR